MVTVEESEELWEIDQAIVDKLKNDGITGYFKVQLKVIPLLLRFNSQNSVQPRDMCISAPTGSGKTLAYVIPIINLLKNKFTSRLRALVILPGRELAIQVHKVFKNLTNHTSIRTLCTVGQSNFIEEQCILMGTNITNDTSVFFSNNQLYKNESTECVIDIMISTPGRLMEHLNNTKGFNLHHLRYLVLDEADRLLGNAYSFWVKSLVESTYISTNSLNSYEIDKLVPIHHPLQRLLFSATLSDNPKKLALLGIRNPLVIQVGSEGDIELSDENIKNPLETFKYELPSTLSESIKICTTTDRPKHLIAVLAQEFNIFSVESTEETNKLCIIFSSSIETTHRLCLLLQLYNGQDISTDSDLPDDDLTRYLFKGKIAEISSLMKASEKEKTIQEALNNKIKILVASDQLSRGIDLPNVKLVINYDPPKYSRTYIHRVGRTARANRFGHCITFLRKRQLDSFVKLRESIGKESNCMNKIPKRKVPKSLTDTITPLYLTALSNLQIHLNK